MLNIAERKQTETELLAAIESVMKDTSWLGQKVLERLASVTRHAGRTRRDPGPVTSRRARGRCSA